MRPSGNSVVPLYTFGRMVLALLTFVMLIVAPKAFAQVGDASAGRISASPKSAVASHYAKLPLVFEPNVGQSRSAAKFIARTSSYALFLTPEESVFALHAEPRTGTSGSDSILGMRLAGSRGSSWEALEQLPGKSNYLIGKGPDKWHTNIPNYAKVAQRGIYSGIDLVFHGNQRQVEYDFVVAPHGNAKEVRLSFRCASGLEVDAQGDLVARTANGEVRFHKPVAYQQGKNGRELIAASYVLRADRTVGFRLGSYDPARELVIDPILEYSTYVGGSNIDGANAIAVAPDGTAFITGGTYSVDFPTAHSLQPNHGGQDDFYKDAFVAKLSADGSTLLYSTYLGGSHEDEANGIAVDTYGDAYVTGSTDSGDFPVSDTIPTINPSCGGDNQCGATWNPQGAVVSNGFIVKLNPAGSALLYSSFIGYYEVVRARSVAVDVNQIAYVTGDVSANITPTVPIILPNVPPPPFPITANAAQPTFGGGSTDSFLMVISASGTSILYSTYLGGSNEDGAYGVAVDGSRNGYVAGLTYSPDLPVTGSAYQAANVGNGDAFFAKINTDTGALLYSTFLGSGGLDRANAIALDSANNAYITGTAGAAGLPSPVAFAGQGDAFVAKFNASASGAASLVYFTYLGGSLADSGDGIAVDSAGNAYVTGSTVSPDFPVAGAVFQPHFGGGNADAFVSKLDPTGTTLIYSGYLGGSNTDTGYGIAVDTGGNAYVAGQTCSVDFPLSNPEQPTYGGNCDAFISKVGILDGISLNPTGLFFPSLNIGAVSLPQSVTLINGDNTVNITAIALVGVSPGDFAETTTCPNPGSLQPGAQCTFSVTFSPTASGVRKALLSVTYTANGTTFNSNVSLTGSTSTVQLSSSSLDFGNQSVGTTSAPQSVTVTNIGASPLTISSVTASGSYAQTNNCTTAPLQPNTNCTIKVTFSPTAAGATTGALAVNDNVAGSPQVVLLNGTGLQPDFALSAAPSSASIVAGSSTTFTVNVSSISGFAQAVGLTCTGFPQNSTCSITPGSVSPGANASTTATVTIATHARTLVPPGPGVRVWPRFPMTLFPIGCLLLLLAVIFTWLRHPRRTAIGAFGLLLFVALMIGACNGGTPAGGGSSGTLAGTYQIAITGTSGNLTHSVTTGLQVK